MKQSRFAAALVLIVALVIALPASAKVTITFRHWNANAGIDGTWRKFNESQNEIEVVFAHTSFGEYIEKTLLEMASGEGPDIFSLQDWPYAAMSIDAWAKNGQLLDLSPGHRAPKPEAPDACVRPGERKGQLLLQPLVEDGQGVLGQGGRLVVGRPEGRCAQVVRRRARSGRRSARTGIRGRGAGRAVDLMRQEEQGREGGEGTPVHGHPFRYPATPDPCDAGSVRPRTVGDDTGDRPD